VQVHGALAGKVSFEILRKTVEALRDFVRTSQRQARDKPETSQRQAKDKPKEGTCVFANRGLDIDRRRPRRRRIRGKPRGAGATTSGPIYLPLRGERARGKMPFSRIIMAGTTPANIYISASCRA
jgi:hypothetical protein